MLILISPAKTLDFETPAPRIDPSEPLFLERSALVMARLRTLSAAKLAGLMDISPALAELNARRNRDWEGSAECARAKEALFAFHGDVYGGLDAATLTRAQVRFAQRHLRILSGLYGVLKPADRIEPYRLEMGTPLPVARKRNLYAFWGEHVTGALSDELERHGHSALVNLASQEYFKVVLPARLGRAVITPVFEEQRGERSQVISFFAKRARGLMARFAITRRITDPQALKAFDLEGYAFDAATSDERIWRFRRRGEGGR